MAGIFLCVDKMNSTAVFLSIADLFIADAMRIHSRMESARTEHIVAMDWESILFVRRPVVARNGIAWQGILLAAIVFLHFTLLAYVFSWRTTAQGRMPFPDAALQVSFIDRISSNEAGQSTPERHATNTAGARAVISNADHGPQSGNLKPIGVETPDHPLRLTLGDDEWQTATISPAKDPLKRQQIALAGRAEPFIQGIRLAGTLSPKQRLEKVGMLFGAISYDPCKEARNRMAMGLSEANALDVEADLRSIELNCRP